jgi:hypothetical protein
MGTVIAYQFIFPKGNLRILPSGHLVPQKLEAEGSATFVLYIVMQSQQSSNGGSVAMPGHLRRLSSLGGHLVMWTHRGNV